MINLSRGHRIVIWIALCIVTLLSKRSIAFQSSGLIVEESTGESAAAKAGIQPGDRIIRYDGTLLTSPSALQAVEENTFGKKNAVLEVLRGGENLRVTVPLGALGLEVRPALSASVEQQFHEGRTALRARQTEQALVSWETAARQARQEGQQKVGAWLYGLVGKEQENQGRWERACEAFISAWELLKEGNDRAEQAQVLSGLGRCHENRSDFSAAEKWFEQARQADETGGNELWMAGDLYRLGNVAYDRGSLVAAKDYYTQALAIRERLAPDSLALASSLNSLGNVAYRRGDLAAAEDYYRHALGIKERLAPDSLTVSASLSNLGNVIRDRGDLDGAQDYGRRALMIEERLAPDSLYVAQSLLNLGNIAFDRGDLAAAQDSYSRAQAILERLSPNSLEAALSLDNVGIIAAVRGDLATASDYFKRALAIEEQLSPGSLNVARTLDNLGVAAADRHDPAAAQDYHLRALAIRQRLAPDSLDVADTLDNLGDVAYRRDHLTEAQDYYQRAFAIREGLSPNSGHVAESLTHLGKVAFKQHRFSDARSLFARASAIIESQRARIPSAEARAFLLAKYKDSYAGLLRADLALHDLPAAFYTLERARARSLLDLLAEGQVDVRQDIEPELLKRERSLQQALNDQAFRQSHLLAEKHTKEEAAAIATEINATTAQFRQVETDIRARSPRYAALTQPQPLKLAQVQHQILDSESLLLEYSLGEETSYLFVVSPTSIKSYRLPKRTTIEAVARRAYELLTTRNRRDAKETAQQWYSRVQQAEIDYAKAGAELSKIILAPAAGELEHKRLLIVGDGILLQIPFSALPDPSAGPQPLLAAHEIVNLPSASVLDLQRRELAGRKPASRQLAVFADPVFEAADHRIEAAKNGGLADSPGATTTPMPATRNLQPYFPRAFNQRMEIARLPFSRIEANAIFALTTGHRAMRSLDFDASKAAATAPSMSRYRIVHFATHALLNNDHPELSGIVLSLVDRKGQAVDGFLRLNEIYHLRLPADLVVLSACETGLGKQIEGEGLIGLTRGFMYAGAARVVASLWTVDDQATAKLMSRFYEGMLKEGKPAAAALRQAQMEMILDTSWHEPYFWAGFELQGEWKQRAQ
jgi:CHAT domain-containing protein/tetratricopeptide (TPR) repeat protein